MWKLYVPLRPRNFYRIGYTYILIGAEKPSSCVAFSWQIINSRPFVCDPYYYTQSQKESAFRKRRCGFRVYITYSRILENKMTDKIDSLLEIENKNPWKRWIFWSVFTIVVLALYRFIMVEYRLEDYLKINTKKEELEFFSNLVLSVIASILGAVAVTFVYIIPEPKRLKSILSLARKDFILEFLKECRYYDNRYCENYNTSIKLEKHNDLDGFFFCKMEYNYRKTLRHRQISMRIDRLKKDSEQNENNKTDMYLEHEFYWKLDEREIKENFPLTNYIIKNLFINKEHQIDLERIDDNNSGCIRFEGYIPKQISLDDMVELSYIVRFPIESESVINIVYELPTKGVKLKFDYNLVKDDVDFYSQLFISSRNGPTSVVDDEGIDFYEKEFQYAGWLMPKNGCYFVWWRKPTQ